MHCNSDAVETPHFSSITRPHLAQETINQILGNLKGDTKTLIACTLASRLFLHSAWSELYRTCTLELPAKRPLKWKGEAEPPVLSSTDKAGTEHPLVLFTRFLATAQHAPSHIKQLRISAKKNNERQSPMALHHLHYILSLLPKLESLCLEQISIYIFSQVANASDETITISTPPRHRYHLQHLALLDTNLHTFLGPGQSELLFDLFDMFERVDSLELKTN
ncbi:hypothetical protein C8Q75DRAFT_497955 [Abortiporus biennis]|nr:hypothetical protein C8Q75DRAFT_497955 [Abortiporus biennis]